MTAAAELDALIEDLTLDAYGEEEQLLGFLVGAQEALRRGEPATIVDVAVELAEVDCGPDVRTGLIARVRRNGTIHKVALADVVFAPGSKLGLVAAAYRRWQRR